MTQPPRTTLTATVLDAPDPRELARFYQRLLGWPIGRDEPDWVTLRPPGAGAGLSFQAEKGSAPGGRTRLPRPRRAPVLPVGRLTTGPRPTRR
jgi:Glyoxalase-like domain